MVLPVVLGCVVVVVVLWLLYVYLDVQRRKKKFEAEGLQVLSQMFWYANPFVNLFPRNRWGLWLFPFRHPFQFEYQRIWKEHADTDIIGFVSFGYQEIMVK